MTNKLLIFLFLFASARCLSGQEKTPFLPFDDDPDRSATYQETIAFYEALAARHPELAFRATGATDSSYPLHYAVLSKEQEFSPPRLRNMNKQILFINNAIHPGEPCGVDATMLLLRDYLEAPALPAFLDQVVLVVIPFYNVGGGLNRGPHSRVNQNGPAEHGFRGNARNLDLNRDFMKADSRNAQTFTRLFTLWQPDVFIDNHTSNGADYPYTLTLVPTQHNKLEPSLAGYLRSRLLPRLYEDMAARNWEMTPYVYTRNTPDEGIYGFLDLPRFSSGYAALHNTIGFMVETHMLKPYADRVRATYTFMDVVAKAMTEQRDSLQLARALAITSTMGRDSFALNWEVDTTRADTLAFKGYTAKYKPSEVSGLPRLYYDRSAPYTRPVPYFNYYRPTLSVAAPEAYLIPQAWPEVIERLQRNGVQLERLPNDTAMTVEYYYIEDYATTDYPYEGHYLHSQVQVKKEKRTETFRAGDYLVFTNQPANQFIVAALEPQGPDSWFAWNFFDSILMRKEYFSSYVFEDLAAQYLAENPELQAALETRKAEDEAFAQSARAQLNFIYQQSPHYEKTHRRYPVARVINKE